MVNIKIIKNYVSKHILSVHYFIFTKYTWLKIWNKNNQIIYQGLAILITVLSIFHILDSECSDGCIVLTLNNDVFLLSSTLVIVKMLRFSIFIFSNRKLSQVKAFWRSKSKIPSSFQIRRKKQKTMKNNLYGKTIFKKKFFLI